MLTKYKDVRPKNCVESPLKNVFMSTAYSENFSGGGHPISIYFQAYFFFSRIILKHIENEKGPRGVRGGGGCSPRIFLKIYIL